MKYITTIEDIPLTIEIDDKEQLIVDGEEVVYDLQPSPDPTLFSLLLGNKSYDMRITPGDESYTVLLQGESLEVQVEDERTNRLAGVKGRMASGTGEIILKAPMPGVIVDLLVAEGDEVEEGQRLLVLESMKMHNEFKSPRKAVVKDIRIQVGSNLKQKEVMLVLE